MASETIKRARIAIQNEAFFDELIFENAALHVYRLVLAVNSFAFSPRSKSDHEISFPGLLRLPP